MTSLLPQNASALEKRLDTVNASRFDLNIRISELWNPYTCPIDFLPYLAFAFSVDYWDENWSEEAKREVVAQAIKVHRHKGTPGALKDMLRAAGYGEVELVEGLDARRRDGHVNRDGIYFHSEFEHWALFNLRLLSPVSIEQANQIKTLVNRVKREVCELHAFIYDRALNLHNNVILRDGTFTRGVVDGQSV
ncbi:MAG: phage tail protein I [Parvibaculaceae bacterium]|nr:phage tail protein I [Parvibaculaceae bacterium]